MTYTEYLTSIKAKPVKDFNALVEGKNLSHFCRVFNIPLRTAQDWKSGKRIPPPYILELLGFAIINEKNAIEH